MGEEPERSGVHLTGEDSGWPVGDEPQEPDPRKTGEGEPDDDDSAKPKAESVEDGTITTDE